MYAGGALPTALLAGRLPGNCQYALRAVAAQRKKLHVGEGNPAEGTSSSRVELRLAGAFGVVLNGRELAPGEVGSRKARTLLKLLAVERRGLLSADRIADVLWDAAGGAPAARGARAGGDPRRQGRSHHFFWHHDDARARSSQDPRR